MAHRTLTQTDQPTTKVVRPRMFETSNNLAAGNREKLVRLLNERLADSFDLYSQVKHAHWNVKGMDFFQLHKLFDELAETVEKNVDVLAERATALGGSAMGTVRMASAGSNLEEMPANTTDEREFLDALIERYASLGKLLRESIDEAEELEDQATMDVFVEVVRDIDQGLYFLEAHMQKAR